MSDKTENQVVAEPSLDVVDKISNNDRAAAIDTIKDMLFAKALSLIHI